MSSRLTCAGTAIPGRDPQGAYLVEDYAKDIEGLAEQLRLRNIVIWGNSTGGRVAQVVAGLRPDLVAAVIAEDVGPERPREIAEGFTTRLKQEDAKGWASEDELVAQLKAGVPARPRTFFEPTRTTAPNAAPTVVSSGNVIRISGTGSSQPSSGDSCGRSNHPSSIYWAAAARSSLRNAGTVEEHPATSPDRHDAGLGHYPSEENPGDYLPIVDRFLAGETALVSNRGRRNAASPHRHRVAHVRGDPRGTGFSGFARFAGFSFTGFTEPESAENRRGSGSAMDR